jgi:hypothetical protein
MSNLILSNPIAKQIYEIGLELYSKNPDILQLTIGLMQEVEKLYMMKSQTVLGTRPNEKMNREIMLNGTTKKNLVIMILKLIVANVPNLNQMEKQTIDMYIDKFLPQLIDILIQFSNGELTISMASISENCCFPGLF